MAATTITRSTIVDDSGAGTDGTIINSSWVGTAIYDKVDALFNSSNPIQYEKSASGTDYTLGVKNTHATGIARFAAGTDNSTIAAMFDAFGSGHTPSATHDRASGTRVVGNASGGLSVVAAHASGRISFHTGGNTERASISAGGHLILEEQTTNPGTSDLAADAAVAVYTKADKLVFAYNNSGSMTYITLDLDGSDTTLTHGTSAP